MKQIFTWWHRQTFGTFLKTLFSGRYVGKDEFGNKYYKNSPPKRCYIGYNIRVGKITDIKEIKNNIYNRRY